MSTDPTAHLTSVGKALKLFDLIGIDDVVTLPELIRATGWPKSSVLRLLSELIDAGLIRRTSHGGYGITLRTWRIGCRALGSGETHQIVADRLHSLVQQTGETAHYSKYEPGWAVYLQKVDGLHPVRAYTEIGGRSPAYASATGKAMLAWRPEAEIVEIVAGAERYTDATITGPDVALDEAARIRADGYAVNRGEWRAAVWGIGAPLFDQNRQATAAIGVSGPRERIEPEIERFSALVVSAAEAVTTESGGVRATRPMPTAS